jgi:hypothetical protein
MRWLNCHSGGISGAAAAAAASKQQQQQQQAAASAAAAAAAAVYLLLLVQPHAAAIHRRKQTPVSKEHRMTRGPAVGPASGFSASLSEAPPPNLEVISFFILKIK